MSEIMHIIKINLDFNCILDLLCYFMVYNFKHFEKRKWFLLEIFFFVNPLSASSRVCWAACGFDCHCRQTEYIDLRFPRREHQLLMAEQALPPQCQSLLCFYSITTLIICIICIRNLWLGPKLSIAQSAHWTNVIIE